MELLRGARRTSEVGNPGILAHKPPDEWGIFICETNNTFYTQHVWSRSAVGSYFLLESWSQHISVLYPQCQALYLKYTKHWRTYYYLHFWRQIVISPEPTATQSINNSTSLYNSSPADLRIILRIKWNSTKEELWQF